MLKKSLAAVLIFVALLCGCQNNTTEIEKLKKENAQLKRQIEQMSENADKTNNITKSVEFHVQFEHDGTSMIFGNAEHIAKITNVGIIYSPNLDKHLLIIDFHYTNKNTDSANFINDIYCNVTAYQDGIQLDTPGFTSEKNIYDTNNSYKNIKNAEIDTQLAFVLSNTTSDVELELGKYDSVINKTILIKEK